MIKYAEDIVKEIDERGAIEIPDDCVTGEEFEKWLYEEDTEIKNKNTRKLVSRMIITLEDWIEYRNNATKILKANSQYATSKAVEYAIDKQIPKQPRYQNRQWQCPCCKKWSPVTYSPWFCPDCGQAINWAIEELEEEK